MTNHEVKMVTDIGQGLCQGSWTQEKEEALYPATELVQDFLHLPACEASDKLLKIDGLGV